MWSAFIIGFLGSLHCISMCGPLNFAFLGEYISKDTTVLLKRFSIYHIGRLFSYALIGIFAGLLGKAISFIFLQKALSIISGFVFIIFGLLLLIPYFKSRMYNAPSIINKLSANILKNKKWNKNSFIHGVLNGLIPCGLVYMALTAAITTFSINSAIIYMILFGLGTLPALLLLMLFGKRLSKYLKINYKLIIPIFFLISGIITLIKTFNIAIPTSLDFWNSTLNPIMCH